MPIPARRPLPVSSTFSMAAASPLTFAASSLPLSNHASVSGEAQFFSSSLRRPIHPITMNARTASLSHRLAESLGTTEVGEDSGAPSPLDVEANADKFICIDGSSNNVKGPITQFPSSQIEASTVLQEKLVIRNTNGENLVGVIQEAGSSELVILCHGFRSSKESKTLLNLADALVSENISVFRFDFSGNGESDGTFQYGNYWKEVEDLRAVTQFFSGQNREVHAIVGHSKGGNVVLLYASKFHDIHRVVNISGRFGLKKGIEARLGKDFMERIKKDEFIDVMDKTGRFIYCVTRESLIDRLSTDMHDACLSIDKNCRVLTVHGSEDDVVPHEDAFEFDKLIINHKLQIIEGADHRFISHQNYLARVLLDFIR
ncbi:uncharacterized protein LOC122042142 [Zingiber officinale]|uniref:uncharacterized protein LOC122042142 n=1 Tax=Zingiber officinale TaxID=94328 RepID=UPI001C4C7CA7|nr:uncharacterized protein LOC122042142 [Zingiber officinale]XP_042458036.1 uncharacterized protein LOC122042142 [Zingiber officinale]XP_042458037.1 uncharacterized protein LOC122042142 [Zingiber officinale]XP_042458038.1 uncharacterized protein LOC122042142 [Zingiber officinale]XP_042458039.1 uncharacterized protein LOC122042142 [Zingiber officinale]XP_042458040.1 uncharacterized protein LOC122042142 [Zingiber officinale]XP_042458041.1 uncharacterized protein LOC122042142 [Zingiber officinal